MDADYHFDVLIITPSTDHALLEVLSIEKKIVLCEFKQLKNDITFKIISLYNGHAEKYSFPKSFDEYSVSKIIGEKIRHHFGIPKLIDFDLRVQPIWLASYFTTFCRSNLILRHHENVDFNKKSSWLASLARLVLCPTIELTQQFLISNFNPTITIPKFDDFWKKKDFYINIYNQFTRGLKQQTNTDTIHELKRCLEQSKAEKKVLIISYFSPYSSAIGATRPTYWLRKLSEISNNSIETFLVTSFKIEDKTTNIFEIKDETIFNFSNHLDWLNFEMNLTGPVSSQAATWTLTLYKNLNKEVLSLFDDIIITGNPFYLFHLPILWGKWVNCPQIYLDYRDPFAENTRFSYSMMQRKKARAIEKRWNESADKVIVVNKTCKDLAIIQDPHKILVIENGFDEDQLGTASKSIKLEEEKVHLVYAGSIYNDRNIVPLLESLNPQKHVLHVAGRIVAYENEIINCPMVRYHGLLSYSEVMQLIEAADIAVLLLSGCSFVSTTKIYDYISLNKFILALSDSPMHEDTFLNDFPEYKSKILLENNSFEIRKFIDDPNFNLKKQDLIESAETSIYSRRFSTTKLAQDILGS